MQADAVVAEAVDLHAQRPGGLLPLLHEIQDRLGHVPPDSVPVIARAMHLSIAEVHGVISFYHHFRQQAPGRHVLRLCRAEACQSMGAEALMARARKALGIEGAHGTSADGAVTLEPVYCLGNCACAPAALVDDELRGRLDASALDALIAQCRAA
jgi:formate dehydrogenase subunit gamma